eukprot:1236207-Pyramimonas_sp.AAC.1
MACAAEHRVHRHLRVPVSSKLDQAVSRPHPEWCGTWRPINEQQCVGSALHNGEEDRCIITCMYLGRLCLTAHTHERYRSVVTNSHRMELDTRKEFYLHTARIRRRVRAGNRYPLVPRPMQICHKDGLCHNSSGKSICVNLRHPDCHLN